MREYETDYEAWLAWLAEGDYEGAYDDYVAATSQYGALEPWRLCKPGCYWCYGKAGQFWDHLDDFADDVLRAENLQKIRAFKGRVQYTALELDEIENLQEAVQLAYEIKAFEPAYWDWVNRSEGDPFLKDPIWLGWTGLTAEENLALLQIEVPD